MKDNINKEYTVYKHIFPNGKIYIGITCNAIEIRWGKNGYGYKTQFVGKAIKKYGWDNIQHIIVRSSLSEEEAKIVEKKLIKRYKTTDLQFGYNRTAGGDSQRHGYKLSNKEKQKRSNCKYCESLKKDIDCYDLEGNFIKTFHGYKEAYEETGVPKSNIIQSAQQKIGRAKEYMFRFHKEDCETKIKPYEQPVYSEGKEVNQYSLDGIYIKTFKNQLEAERQTDVSCSGISACCLGKCKTYGGYIWLFNEGNTNNISPRKNKIAPKTIVQRTLEGEKIAVFSSMKEASRQTEISYDVIRHYIDGTRKSGGGFLWESVEVNYE